MLSCNFMASIRVSPHFGCRSVWSLALSHAKLPRVIVQLTERDQHSFRKWQSPIGKRPYARHRE